MLPEFGTKILIDDPDRLLLNQIPLEPVVQFYLDAPQMGAITAHLEFLYGEDRVTPDQIPEGLLRDARTERRAVRLLSTYLEPSIDVRENGVARQYSTYNEDTIDTFWRKACPL